MQTSKLIATIVGTVLASATAAMADPLACADLAAKASTGVRIDTARAFPAGTLPTDNPLAPP